MSCYGVINISMNIVNNINYNKPAKFYNIKFEVFSLVACKFDIR